MGYLFVSMDILSGSAGVLGEWLKEHEPVCPKPSSRRPYETQEVDNDKETSARFGNVFDTLYMMNHRHPSGLQTPPRRLSLVVRAP